MSRVRALGSVGQGTQEASRHDAMITEPLGVNRKQSHDVITAGEHVSGVKHSQT